MMIEAAEEKHTRPPMSQLERISLSLSLSLFFSFLEVIWRLGM